MPLKSRFECEPGTLSDAKLGLLRELGVTRLSLGVESYDDRILELNGRAHRSPEIYRVFEQARRFEGEPASREPASVLDEVMPRLARAGRPARGA